MKTLGLFGNFRDNFNDIDEDTTSSIYFRGLRVGSDKISRDGICRFKNSRRNANAYSLYIPKVVKKKLSLEEKAELL